MTTPLTDGRNPELTKGSKQYAKGAAHVHPAPMTSEPCWIARCLMGSPFLLGYLTSRVGAALLIKVMATSSLLGNCKQAVTGCMILGR